MVMASICYPRSDFDSLERKYNEQLFFRDDYPELIEIRSSNILYFYWAVTTGSNTGLEISSQGVRTCSIVNV
jgi:hypothetical protein